jgi:hypothetical protein
MRLFLLVLGIVFAVVLFLQWRDWPPQLPDAPERLPGQLPQGITAAATPSPPPIPPLEDYASIAERPLFLPDRRPPPDEPEGSDEPVPEVLTELAGTDLNAVVITPLAVSAWLRRPNSRELVRVRLGDDFEGWTITGIEPDRLLLERQGETDELILRDYQNAPPQIPPTRQPAMQRGERPSDGLPSDPRRTESGRPSDPRSESPVRGSATPEAADQPPPTRPRRPQPTTDARRLSRSLSDSP